MCIRYSIKRSNTCRIYVRSNNSFRLWAIRISEKSIPSNWLEYRTRYSKLGSKKMSFGGIPFKLLAPRLIDFTLSAPSTHSIPIHSQKLFAMAPSYYQHLNYNHYNLNTAFQVYFVHIWYLLFQELWEVVYLHHWYLCRFHFPNQQNYFH